MRPTQLKKQLESTILKANAQLSEMRVAEHEKRNQKFVGRYFRYHNCYSCATKPGDYWWMYFRVNSLTDGLLVVHKFQTDTKCIVCVEPNECFTEMLEGCKEITRQQYEKAFAKAIEAASVVVA